MANTRCPTSVATKCSTSSGRRRSMKHSAKRPTSRIARSVAPKSSAPASGVIAPPSNPATTARPSTAAKSNNSALHSVGIGALLESPRSRSRKTTFADSALRCAQLCEISGLTALARHGAACRSRSVVVMTKDVAIVASALMLAGASIAAAQTAPSFDCATAKAAVERAICADPALADTDSSIAAVYQGALDRLEPANAAALRADQRAWLAARNAAFGRGDYDLKLALDERFKMLRA